MQLIISPEFLNNLNTLQGKDKFPGRATIKADSLEKHQYSEAINPKRFKSKYAQKLAVKREHDRKSAHETAARTELLLGDDAGFIEGDSDDEFTGRYNTEQIPLFGGKRMKLIHDFIMNRNGILNT